MTKAPMITRVDEQAEVALGRKLIAEMMGHDRQVVREALAAHRTAAVAEMTAEAERLKGVARVAQESHDWMYGEKQRLENALKDIASRAHASLSRPGT